jgi:type IV pilus assembly protein PilC
MIYPSIVISGLVGVGFVMMFFVMPQLTDIMKETGAKLPLATRLVIGASDFLSAYAWIIGVFLVGLVVATRSFYKTPVGRRYLDRALLHMPLFGKLFGYTYLVRFCRSFGTMLKGGVTITRGLEVSSEVVRNAVYKELIDDTLAAVTDGASVASVFSRSFEVPKMLGQMMSVGEKVGHLDTVLDKVADFYSRELKAKLENINTIMEPVIMIIMGIGVGIMVAAVIMPMYNVATSF